VVCKLKPSRGSGSAAVDRREPGRPPAGAGRAWANQPGSQSPLNTKCGSGWALEVYLPPGLCKIHPSTTHGGKKRYLRKKSCLKKGSRSINVLIEVGKAKETIAPTMAGEQRQSPPSPNVQKDQPTRPRS